MFLMPSKRIFERTQDLGDVINLYLQVFKGFNPYRILLCCRNSPPGVTPLFHSPPDSFPGFFSHSQVALNICCLQQVSHPQVASEVFLMIFPNKVNMLYPTERGGAIPDPSCVISRRFFLVLCSRVRLYWGSGGGKESGRGFGGGVDQVGQGRWGCVWVGGDEPK